MSWDTPEFNLDDMGWLDASGPEEPCLAGDVQADGRGDHMPPTILDANSNSSIQK